jgi:hypothetical protein
MHKTPLLCTLTIAAACALPAQTEPVTLATLRYSDITTGTGAPAAAGKKFIVHYTGWLTNGTKFDSSVDRKEPFSFVQGRRQVIAGWDIGFEGMKAGGKRKLFIPYQLAYGELGNGSIPPKAELIFDVELLDVVDAVQTPAAVDVLVPFTELETKVIELAKAVPDDKFAPVAKILLHIASLNDSIREAAQKDPPAIAEWRTDAQIEGKSAVIDAVIASFAAVRRRMESARAGSLGSDATLFGKATTRRGLFTALDEAIGEQYGLALAYER